MSTSTGLKSLPVLDLFVVGVLYEIGPADDGGREFDYEALMPELRSAASFGDEKGRCDCCGQRLKYACEVVHKPSLQGYYVGRSCAGKIEGLRRSSHVIEQTSVALAERAACNGREKAFRLLHPEACAALDWAKTPVAPAIARDMLAKLRRYGSLSSNQIAVIERIRTADSERRARATGTAQSLAGDRRSLSGTVVSLKNEPEPDGRGEASDRWKMIVDCGGGVRIMGTCPQALLDVAVAIGDSVRFSAVVQPSSRDPLFGFFSRPTKAAKVPSSGAA